MPFVVEWKGVIALPVPDPEGTRLLVRLAGTVVPSSETVVVGDGKDVSESGGTGNDVSEVETETEVGEMVRTR